MEEINLYERRVQILKIIYKNIKEKLNEQDLEYLVYKYGKQLIPEQILNNDSTISIPYYDSVSREFYYLWSFNTQKEAIKNIELDEKLYGLFTNPNKDDFIAKIVHKSKKQKFIAFEAGIGTLDDLIYQRMDQQLYWYERENDLFYIILRLYDLTSRMPKRDLFIDDLRPENFIFRKVKRKSEKKDEKINEFFQEDDKFTLIYLGLDNLQFDFSVPSNKDSQNDLFSVNKEAKNIYKSKLTRQLATYYSIGRIIQYICLSSIYAKQKEFYEKLNYETYDKFIENFFQKNNSQKTQNLLKIYYPYYVVDLIEAFLSLSIEELEMNKLVNSLRKRGSKFIYNIDSKIIKQNRKKQYIKLIQQEAYQNNSENTNDIQSIMNFYLDFELEDMGKFLTDDIIEKQCEGYQKFNSQYYKYPIVSVYSTIFRKRCNLLTQEQDTNKVLTKIKYSLKDEKVQQQFLQMLQSQQDSSCNDKSLTDFQKLQWLIEIIFIGSQFKETVYQQQDIDNLKIVIQQLEISQEGLQELKQLVLDSIDFFLDKGNQKQIEDYQSSIKSLQEKFDKNHEEYTKSHEQQEQPQQEELDISKEEEDLNASKDGEEQQQNNIENPENDDDMTDSQILEIKKKKQKEIEEKKQKEFKEKMENYQNRQQKFQELNLQGSVLIALMLKFQYFVNDILGIMVKNPDNEFLISRMKNIFNIENPEQKIENLQGFQSELFQINQQLLESSQKISQFPFLSQINNNKNQIYTTIRHADSYIFKYELIKDKESKEAKDMLQQANANYQESQKQVKNINHTYINHILQNLLKKLGEVTYLQENYDQSSYWDQVALQNKLIQFTDLSKKEIHDKVELYNTINYLKDFYRNKCYKYNNTNDPKGYFRKVVTYLTYMENLLKYMIPSSVSRNMFKITITEELIFVSGLEKILNSEVDYQNMIPKIFEDLKEKEQKEYKGDNNLIEVQENGKDQKWENILEITPYIFKIFLIQKFIESKGESEKANEYLNYVKQQYCENQEILNELTIFEMELLILSTKQQENPDWDDVNFRILKDIKILKNPTQIQQQAIELIKQIQQKEAQDKINNYIKQKEEQKQKLIEDEERKIEEERLRKEREEKEKEEIRQFELELEKQRDLEQQQAQSQKTQEELDLEFQIKQKAREQKEEEEKQEKEKNRKEKLNERKQAYQKQQTAKFNQYQEKKRKEKEEALKRSESACCTIF